jgi:tetratricopeptide (TPR) repeat protein
MRRGWPVAALLAAVLAGCADRAVDKGYACLRLGDYRMAATFFSSELSRHPASFEARLGLGKALLQQSAALGDTSAWVQALTHLEAARTLDPRRMSAGLLSEAWTQRSRVLLARADTMAALEALSRALDLQPRNTEAINLSGSVYFQQGLGDQAEALFRRAVEADTAAAAGYFNLGAVLWARQDWAGARAQWFEAVRRAPEDKDIIYWFALAEKKLREGPAAGPAAP